MTAHSLEALEISDFNAVAHCPWPDFWKDDENVAALNAIKEAQQGRIGRFSGYCETMRGTPKWWDVIVTPILGLDGHPEKLLAVSRDISELKEGEERQKLLAQELAHRVKNILSVVEALSTQTFCGAQSVEEMQSAFSARLMALSRAHDVLLDTSWTDVAANDPPGPQPNPWPFNSTHIRAALP